MKAGSEVKIFKKWKTGEEFEGDAVLVALVKQSVLKGLGQRWVIKFKQDMYSDGEKAKTHKRTIKLMAN